MFSKYLTPNTPIGGSPIWYSTFVFFSGLFIFCTFLSIIDFIHIKKWNKFDLYCSGLVMFFSSALTLQLIPYWYRIIYNSAYALEFTDLIIGLVFAIIIVPIILYLKLKVIPKQKQSEMLDWLLNNWKSGAEDKILNPVYLIKRHIVAQKRKSGAKIKIDDESYTLIKDKVVHDYCNQIEDIIERLIKDHHIAEKL